MNRRVRSTAGLGLRSVTQARGAHSGRRCTNSVRPECRCRKPGDELLRRWPPAATAWRDAAAMPGARAHRDDANDDASAGGAGSRSRRGHAVRGRPPLEVRLPILAIATGFADFADADNTEAKVMRPNDQVERRAGTTAWKQKLRTGGSARAQGWAPPSTPLAGPAKGLALQQKAECPPQAQSMAVSPAC